MVDTDCSIFEKEKNISIFIPDPCSFMMLQEENELATGRVFGIAVLPASDCLPVMTYPVICFPHQGQNKWKEETKECKSPALHSSYFKSCSNKY